jgi:hypothetical protein
MCSFFFKPEIHNPRLDPRLLLPINSLYCLSGAAKNLKNKDSSLYSE